MTSWRTSGACMGGSGSEMSSKQMVRRMPGRSRAGSGSAVAQRVLEGVADGRHRVARARRAARGRRRPGCPRAAARGRSPRRARTAWAGWSGRPRGRIRAWGSSAASFLAAGRRRRRRSKAILTAPRRPAAPAWATRLFEAVERVGGRDQPAGAGGRRPPPWPGRRCARGRSRRRARLGAVGVGADERHLAVPQRGQVDADPAGHAHQDHPAPGPDHGQRTGRSTRPSPRSRSTTSAPPVSRWPARRRAQGERAAAAPHGPGQLVGGQRPRSAPSSPASRRWCGVAGADEQRAGAWPASGRREVSAAAVSQAEGAGAEHRHRVAVVARRRPARRGRRRPPARP